MIWARVDNHNLTSRFPDDKGQRMRRFATMFAAFIFVVPVLAASAVAAQAPPATMSDQALGPKDLSTTGEPLASAGPVTAPHAMVVTAQHLATEVGVDILKQGGNAVDAAVAVGYALAVVHPCCGNIGGGGFMTVHLADGRGHLPRFPREGAARRPRRPCSATPRAKSCRGAAPATAGSPSACRAR